MCIIIHAGPGKKLDSKELSTAFDNNPDGVGFIAFGEDEGKEVYYTAKWLPSSVEEVEDVFNKHIDDDLVLHLRYRTTGDIEENSCHPFELFTQEELDENYSLYQVWIMHNGTFTFTPEGEMDTLFVIESIIKPILKNDINVLHDTWFTKAMERLLAGTGKLTFITEYGDIIHIGNFSDRSGCKVSNTYSFNPYHRTGYQQQSGKDTSTKHIGDKSKSTTGNVEKLPDRKLDLDLAELESCFDSGRVKMIWNDLPDSEKMKIAMRRPTLLIDLLDLICEEDELNDGVADIFKAAEKGT